MGNALKFTLQGSVEILVEERSFDPQTGQCELYFQVKDTGIGILPEHQSSVFEAFQQADGSISRHYGGTGLGLAICKRLTELMGGKIWFETEPGVGSNFQFTIVLERPEMLKGDVSITQTDRLEHLESLKHLKNDRNLWNATPFLL